MSNSCVSQPTIAPPPPPIVRMQCRLAEGRWPEVQGILDTYSADGWELVSVVQGRTGAKLVFKPADVRWTMPMKAPMKQKTT